jgi:hypothetical protein
LNGLYQVASTPISKYNLLKLVALSYKKEVEVIENNTVVESKILSGEKFLKIRAILHLTGNVDLPDARFLCQI